MPAKCVTVPLTVRRLAISIDELARIPSKETEKQPEENETTFLGDWKSKGHPAHSRPHLRTAGIYYWGGPNFRLIQFSRGAGMNQRSFQFKGLALLLALLLSEPGWTATPTVAPQLPDPGSVGMTKEQQVQLGRQAMAEVYQQMPVLPDSSPQTQYVRQLGKRLADVIPQQYSWPFEFHVIPQKDINAFALPGGPMFVNVGAIVAADNEAELAGVMAHEMSHVYMQHSAKQAGKAQWTSLLGALGGLFGGGAAGSLARLGIQLGAGTLMMKYSRGDEAQADAVGAIIMYKAGYNPRALADFFEKLERQGGGGGPQFLSDHPNPGNRQAAIEKEVSNWPPKNYVSNSQAFVRAKAGCERGEEPTQASRLPKAQSKGCGLSKTGRVG